MPLPAYVPKLKKIVSDHQYAKIGGVIVDVQTARLILQVRGGLNPENKKKFDKLPMAKKGSIVWKLVK